MAGSNQCIPFDAKQESSDCVIKGLNFAGVTISGGGGNVIQGDYIGVDAAGASATDTGGSVSTLRSSNNVIGGADTSMRNIISGPTTSFAAVSISNSAHNEVRGNYIGTDATGKVALGGN